MATSTATSGGRVVGDYIFDRKIGTGAFSTVWRARHRLRGTQVAVKEIALDRLSDKLRHNLMSEVSILRRINHPNIIALFDYVQASGRIYIVLEYCSGGDLSGYIQNHGRVAEATAKHFMRQLATGLQVLRDNNVIHRDLKPQNLLLSTNDDSAVLKIADFGFARSLQPRGLAETLCGSPLYMAPEVMQSQKYDAKADLWSVGIILYQLVTGRTPFTGNSQLQLLQNIIKTNELNFPSDHNLSRNCVDLCQKLLRRSAVERLTFEEFFNHQFLSEQPEISVSRVISSTRNGFPSFGSFEGKPSRSNFNEDYLPFPLDDEPIGQDVDQSFPMGKSSTRPRNKLESSSYRQDSSRPPKTTKEMGFAKHRKPTSVSPKDVSVIDSLELIDQEYVIVPGPPIDMSSSPGSASSTRNSPYKSESSKLASPKFSALSAPMPIIGALLNNTTHATGSIDSRSSPASGTSHGSTDLGDAMEQPSSNFLTRIKFLQLSAAALSEMVKEKVLSGRQLEAFSVQLVVLAIWKQALHICHAQLASDMDENASRKERTRIACAGVSNMGCSTNSTDSESPEAICSQIEKEFLLGVGNAEELSVDVDQMGGATDMPDAIEIIFQSALTLGRDGAVAEMMGKTMRASMQYAKAACLLEFLLVEAPSLALNPPFSLTNSDRYRLRMYIDVISNRQGQSRFQRMGIKMDDQMMPSST